LRKGGRDDNYISATTSCGGGPSTRRVHVRVSQDRPAIEADGFDGLLGLRRNVVVGRGTGIPVQCLLEPMAEALDPVHMVGGPDHAAAPEAIPLATISR
jgi:hypothetical protein